MDKASDFESEDCEFESRRGRNFTLSYVSKHNSVSQCVHLNTSWYSVPLLRLVSRSVLNSRFSSAKYHIYVKTNVPTPGIEPGPPG